MALEPGEQLWLDAWIPRDDPLWTIDVSAAAQWCGTWWTWALAGVGQVGLQVHRGRAEPGELGDLACFAGRGPGEVFQSGRKVVGLSQWRAREGALFSSCAYMRWDPAPLLAVVNLDETTRRTLETTLSSVATGLFELNPPLSSVMPSRSRCSSRSPTSPCDRSRPGGPPVLLVRSSRFLFTLVRPLSAWALGGPGAVRPPRTRPQGVRPVRLSAPDVAGVATGGEPGIAPPGRARPGPGKAGESRGLQLCCIGL